MLTVTVNGTAYSLDDGTYCYYLGDDGLGAAQVRRLTQHGPLQHGVSDVGYRLEPRSIRLFLELVSSSWNGLFRSERNDLINILKPIENPIILTWDFTNELYVTQRAIDVHFSGDLQMSSQERNPYNQRVAVSFMAPDPTFYDPVANEIILAVGGGTGTAIPLAIPMSVGASSISDSLTISYGGTWRSYPVMRITGPAEDPVITHEGTGFKLDFTGITVAAGTWYEIDLRYGYKTVVDNTGANKIAELTADSDLAEFAILPAPDMPGGENSISFFCNGATVDTQFSVVYYTRYIGI